MKLYFLDLHNQIKKKLSEIYIISSNEMIFCQEACSIIRNFYYSKNNGLQSREIFNTESNNFNVMKFKISITNKSIFSNTLFELNIFKLTNELLNILSSYLINPIKGNILIIIFHILEKNIKKTLFFKNCIKSKFCQLIEINKNNINLKQWIYNRFCNLGIDINDTLIKTIIETMHGNVFSINQAIEKLAIMSISNNKKIELNMIKECGEYSYHIINIIDIIHHALHGEVKYAVNIINNLRDLYFNPLVLLTQLVNQVRVLIKQRFNNKNVLYNCNVFLKEAQLIDEQIKGQIDGGEVVNIWNSIISLIMRFAGTKIQLPITTNYDFIE